MMNAYSISTMSYLEGTYMRHVVYFNLILFNVLIDEIDRNVSRSGWDYIACEALMIAPFSYPLDRHPSDLPLYHDVEDDQPRRD